MLAEPCPGASLFTDEEWHAVVSVARLSPRMAQVARLLFHGHTRRAIAARLLKADGRPIGLSCVDEYVRRLYAKLNVSCLPDVLLRLLSFRRRVVAGAMVRPG